MYKIAILGCENSHADAFLKNILVNKTHTDIEVVGVYSNEPEALERMKNNFGVYCAESYDEFVGKVDGIMITARDGKNHFKYAKPYIEAGIPMFIDKPITSDNLEAVEFMKQLKQHGCRITGGSTCVYGDVVVDLAAKMDTDAFGKVYGGFLRAPISMTNNYGGFFFYSQHLTEVMMKIFGYYPRSVKANKNDNVITLTVRYPEYDVCAQFVDGNYTYAAYVSCEKGVIGGEYPVNETLYINELNSFYSILTGGEGKTDLNKFIAPVFFMSATLKSIESGEEITIEYPEKI